MERKYKFLIHNGTWELVLVPPNKIVVSGKWCYQVKINAGGAVLRHKTRYAACGFTQRSGINFRETTSLVVALTSLQALLAVATKYNMEIKQLNVNSAFPYRDLDEEIYFEQPKGFRVDGIDGKKLVC